MLSEEEQKAFGTALWMPAQRDSFGIPKDTHLPPWVLLTLPEEQPGQARDALLHFIAERSRQGDGGLYERLSEIGELLRQFADLRIAIELPADVRAALATLIDAWTMQRIQRHHEVERFLEQGERLELAALAGVAAILPHIVLSDDLLAKIWKRPARWTMAKMAACMPFQFTQS